MDIVKAVIAFPGGFIGLENHHGIIFYDFDPSVLCEWEDHLAEKKWFTPNVRNAIEKALRGEVEVVVDADQVSSTRCDKGISHD